MPSAFVKQPLLKKLSVTQACGSIRKPPSKLAVVRDANTGTGDEFTDGYDSAEESVGGGFGDSVNTLGKDMEVVRARVPGEICRCVDVFVDWRTGAGV